MKTKRLFMLFSIFVLSLASYAQKELSKSVSTLKNKNEFIETFIKNIAIDKEDYNIYVDYIDKEKGTIIFSGIAKDVGNLTVEVYDVIKSNLAFKVELSFQNSNSTKKWLLTPLNLKLSFQKGEREPYSFLPTSTLEEMENEIRLIEIYGPEFEIDSYFIEDLKKYGTEKNEALLESENSELSKKERKNAKRKYDDVAAKFDFYKKIYDSAVLLLVKLDNYYLN